jgi:hypothetical protein
MPSGRLTEYTPDIAEKICKGIASGISLRKVCADEEMPAPSTVCGWVLDDLNGFAEQYAKARRLQAELLADEIFDISDDSTNDYMIRQSKSGEDYEVANPEVIGRSRLRVDSRKWYLARVLPKIYGDKIQTEHSGSIDHTGLSDEALNARITELMTIRER